MPVFCPFLPGSFGFAQIYQNLLVFVRRAHTQFAAHWLKRLYGYKQFEMVKHSWAAYSRLFKPCWAYSSLFQHIPVVFTTFTVLFTTFKVLFMTFMVLFKTFTVFFLKQHLQSYLQHLRFNLQHLHCKYFSLTLLPILKETLVFWKRDPKETHFFLKKRPKRNRWLAKKKRTSTFSSVVLLLLINKRLNK